LFWLFSVEQLQKKWKNIRDCYFREIRRLKNVRSGAAAPKKSTYIYFDQLHFLKVVTESGPLTSNIERATEPEAEEVSETQSCHDYIPPQKKKRNDDVIGMEMVNVLKSSIKSREESERHDADKLFLLSLLDDFKAIPQYSKNRAKIEMLNLVEKYQPLFASSAHHFQNEIYAKSQRDAYANAATPSSSHHRQRGYYSTSYPDRPSSSHSHHSCDHSTVSSETVSQDSDYTEFFN
jgi:hypothetical protein